MAARRMACAALTGGLAWRACSNSNADGYRAGRIIIDADFMAELLAFKQMDPVVQEEIRSNMRAGIYMSGPFKTRPKPKKQIIAPPKPKIVESKADPSAIFGEEQKMMDLVGSKLKKLEATYKEEVATDCTTEEAMLLHCYMLVYQNDKSDNSFYNLYRQCTPRLDAYEKCVENLAQKHKYRK